MRRLSLLAASLLVLLNSAIAPCAAVPVEKDHPTSVLDWTEDYSTAVRRATDENKMLLIYFYDQEAGEAQSRFEAKTLADTTVQQQMDGFVLARLSVSTMIGEDEDRVRLLDHDSFRYMYGQSGLAIVDLQHKGEEYYGHVVSCFPFESPTYYCPNYESVASVRAMLSLPPGSITQRTMVYAVRMHPERPASTRGRAESVLMDEADQHSRYQARIRLLGHHGWGSRAQRITSRLGFGGGASEVCAESWAGSRLVTACLDCVNAWRHSGAHWSSVSRRQTAFGYDISRGDNGVWYATGIFSG